MDILGSSKKAKVLGFLELIGRDFKKYVLPFAGAAAAGASMFPGLGPLFEVTANAIMLVEQKWAALGKQSGTGEQKLADVLEIAGPMIAQFLADAGQASDAAAVTAWINKVVDVLNLAPAPALKE
jgi:hypothetical protein